MSAVAVLPALVGAAKVGAVIGLGVAFLGKHPVPFVIVLVASVALRAISLYFSVGTAVGLGIGVVFGFFNSKPSDGLNSIIGYALLGAVSGYYLGPVFANLGSTRTVGVI